MDMEIFLKSDFFSYFFPMFHSYFWLFDISPAGILQMASWKLFDPKLATILEFEPLDEGLNNL